MLRPGVTRSESSWKIFEQKGRHGIIYCISLVSGANFANYSSFICFLGHNFGK
jgi:hypothetical protein